MPMPDSKPRIIGRTDNTNHAIYSHAEPSSYSHFTAADHHDAAQTHAREGYAGPKDDRAHHREMAAKHDKIATKMWQQKKNEGSTSARLASPIAGTKSTDLSALQGFAGEPPTFRTKGSESPVQRHRKRKPKDTHLQNRGFSLDQFVNRTVREAMSEVVRKRGQAWVLFDDETGVQLGTYKDRATAWKNQRLRRQQTKLQRKMHAKEKEKHKVATNKSSRGRTAFGKANKRKAGDKNFLKPLKPIKPLQPGVRQQSRQRRQEGFENAVIVGLLMERVGPYVFSQPPSDSASWDSFVSRMSNETMQSDPKFKNMLGNVHKSKGSLLKKALGAVQATLEATGRFKVIVPQTEAAEDFSKDFTVHIPHCELNVPLGMRIQNNKAVLNIPEDTKQALNSLNTEDSKLLRAELMHVQETSLDTFDDVLRASGKRDGYLKTMEGKLDKIVSEMGPMQISMLKNLLKAKYKEMK